MIFVCARGLSLEGITAKNGHNEKESGILEELTRCRRGTRNSNWRTADLGISWVSGIVDFGLQNPDAKRDWGHAREYVKAMWLRLQQGKPDGYVISTGETHSVREFVEMVEHNPALLK